MIQQEYNLMMNPSKDLSSVKMIRIPLSLQKTMWIIKCVNYCSSHRIRRQRSKARQHSLLWEVVVLIKVLRKQKHQNYLYRSHQKRKKSSILKETMLFNSLRSLLWLKIHLYHHLHKSHLLMIKNLIQSSKKDGLKISTSSLLSMHSKKLNYGSL